MSDHIQEKIGLVTGVVVQRERHQSMQSMDDEALPLTGGIFDFLPEGSFQAGVFNIASATLGAGALTLPYAFLQSGLGMGLFWLFFGMLATVYSIRLLVTVLEAVRCSPAWKGPRNLDSYEDLTLHLFGKKTELFVEAQIIIFCYGTAIAYVVAVGDILDPVRKLSFMPDFLQDKYGRELVMIIFWTLFMFPLSLLKSVNSLRFSSMLGVVSILTLVAACIYHCITFRLEDCHDDPRCDEGVDWVKVDGKAVLTIPLIMLAYTCQVNVFSIYQELKDPTPKKMMQITWGGMAGLCFTIYALMGVFGYLDFRSETEGNILKNYEPKKNAFIACAFVAITLTVVVAFPLVVFPCRDSIFSILLSAHGVQERVDQVREAWLHPDAYEVASTHSSHVYMPGPGSAGGLPRVYPKPSNSRHYSVSTAIAFSALLFALVIPKIQVVFSFLGGVCSSYLCFFLPAAFMKKMTKLEEEYWSQEHPAAEERAEDGSNLWSEQKLPLGTVDKIGVELLYWGGIVAGIGSTVVTAVTL